MILLRTLTEKSTLGVGKYMNVRVGDIMAFRTYPAYRCLVETYYRCNRIDYCESVLKALHLYDRQITKPGIDLTVTDDMIDWILLDIGIVDKRKKLNGNQLTGIQKAKIYKDEKIYQGKTHNMLMGRWQKTKLK